MTSCLLVRTGVKRYALPVDAVEQIVRVERINEVPTPHPALRGVTRMGDILVPVVHLGALLAGVPMPRAPSEVGVLVQTDDVRLVLEVDAADDLVGATDPVAADVWDLPWASGVTRWEDALVPVVDLRVLVERLDPERQVTADV